MTSQLPHFWCLFLSSQQQKNIKNRTAVMSLKSILFRDNFSHNSVHYSGPPKTEVRRLLSKFFTANILFWEYLGVVCFRPKNLFCKKKIQLHFPMNKGLTVPKQCQQFGWKQPKCPPKFQPNLSAQAQKFRIFEKKLSLDVRCPWSPRTVNFHFYISTSLINLNFWSI